jgi:hypothetical protein
MVDKPATYRVFWIVFLHQEPSIISIAQLLREAFRGCGIGSRAMTTLITLVMAYILAFPTLAGAMTGYTPVVGGFVEYYEGNFIPLESFQLLAYVIHDGARINLTTDYAVPFNNQTFSEIMGPA